VCVHMCCSVLIFKIKNNCKLNLIENNRIYIYMVKRKEREGPVLHTKIRRRFGGTGLSDTRPASFAVLPIGIPIIKFQQSQVPVCILA
jgi:hypothetical protein